MAAEYQPLCRRKTELTGDGKRMKKLRFRDIIFVASMLFGMFFGAGNLIFPASMGQLAGSNMWQAAAGFLITGVGLPLLGVAALGISREESLLELSSRVGKRYGLFFTCALYLAIGPFLAIPRCATVSFTVGVERILPSEMQTIALVVFSAVFFAATLFFSLRPGEILTWVGKVLNRFSSASWESLSSALSYHRWGRYRRSRLPELMSRQHFSQGCWKDTIQWMCWQALRSGSWWWM